NRWGTINTDRDLSEDQCIAIAACQKLKHGEVLAIHGPPGTGKTAILQEVVANSVVESVLQNREPDLLVVASTNNQAIRNAL
ncbi:AAA domain-containing protein, partial [Priestia megaterium]|uniref:AAA domain-containing protein n=1 Tax=Priestia megaterium TaxID=1404 RepID=UPI0035B6369D